MKTFLALFTILCFTKSHSQNVSFDWVKRLNRQYADAYNEVYTVGSDSLQNVYIAGHYHGTLDLDPGAGVTNVSSNLSAVYIVKLDQLGNFIWGKQLAGQEIYIVSSHVDASGNVFITGFFYGTVDFDPGPSIFNLTTPTTVNYFAPNIFVSKIDANGNFKWAKRVGDLGPDIPSSITVDKFGNVYSTGYTSGTVDFDPGSGVYNITITSGGSWPYILKLDSAGNFRYAKVFETNHYGGGEFIRTDFDGNVYTTGYFTGTMDFDPGPGQFNIIGDFQNNSTYLTKLDSSGNFQWAIQNPKSYQVAIDKLQNIYGFDGSMPGWLTKYDQTGNLLWQKQIGGGPTSSPRHTTNLTIDTYNNLYVTGIFIGTKDFDPGPGIYNLISSQPINSSYTNVFIARYSSNGDFVWAKSLDGNYSSTFPTWISVDSSGNVHSAGVFTGQVDFDPDSPVYAPYNNQGVYIHKMIPCANRSYSTLTITACNSYTLNGTTYDHTGTYTQAILNSSGCDSIIKLNLFINRSINTSNVTACDSFFWNGHQLTTSGLYTDTLLSVNGCDSILKINLTIKKSSHTIVNAHICNGASFAGHNTTGTYIDTFVASNGCDSIRTLHLLVEPSKSDTLVMAICDKQTFLGYSASGIYRDTFPTASGCDSIRTLFLTVHPSPFTQVNQTICKGEVYLNHETSGFYNDTLKTNAGCDSVVLLNLVVLDKPNLHLPTDTVLCEGASLVLDVGFHSFILWQDGTMTQKYEIKKTGIYTVEVSDYCGKAFGKIIVRDTICKVMIPNAFSPNGDGINDSWKISGLDGLQYYNIKIFARSGIPVYESSKYSMPWDGCSKGKLLPAGVYYYIITTSNSQKMLSGWVSIIR